MLRLNDDQIIGKNINSQISLPFLRKNSDEPRLIIVILCKLQEK